MLKISFPLIKASRIIHAPPQKLWDLLTDTTAWMDWGPSIKEIDCEHRYIQTGSKGRIKTVLGFWAPFIITEVNDLRYWSWRVFHIRATGHRIETIDATCCRLVFEVPFWAAPYALICQVAASRIAHLLKKNI